MTDKILAAILATANDIKAYLEDDVPLECYPEDIDHKLQSLHDEVKHLLMNPNPNPES